MQIVAAAYSLAGAGGSESYLVTVADHLQRLGHDVWLHSTDPGASSGAAERLGVRVVATGHELPPAPDVLLVGDGAVACELAASHPLTPQVFVAHSDIFDAQLPPQLPELVAAVVVLHDRVERRIRALAQPVAEIVRLSQPIDVERFKAARPLPARPRVAITLSNYVHGERADLLRRACDRAGLELRHVGQHGAEGQRPADLVLNDADVVVGKARVILEAMACGRAAYVFDHNGGDGWVTPGSYARLAADNFGGQSLPELIDEERLVADLATYDAGMGIVNRDLAVLHHSATKHVAALANVLQRVAGTPRAAPIDAPLAEMARLVRLYHRSDQQAFAARAEIERLGARLHEANLRAAELERRWHEIAASRSAAQAQAEAMHMRADAEAARVAELEAALAGAQAETAAQACETAAQAREAAAQSREAARAVQLLREVTATRRWRGLQAALAPADRLRTTLRRRGSSPPPVTPPLPPAPFSAPSAPPLSAPTPAPAPVVVPEPRRPDAPPAPFIVGVARSGTTLLRLQLDSHPQLAIGPETGFGFVAARLAASPAGPRQLLDAITELDTWPDLGLAPGDARHALEQAQPWSIGGGLRALYSLLAAREHKPRWGDKTPTHLDCMPVIAAALPEARFVHIIRDGRDVAASVRDLPFAPGDGSIDAIARDWRDRVLRARRDAAGVAHYREVRFERLVADAEPVLREICEFLELEFDDAMLRAHERAADMLDRLPAERPEGGGVATRAERIARHAHLHVPPDPARAGRWREALTLDEVARFEAAAGELLADLGYLDQSTI